MDKETTKVEDPKIDIPEAKAFTEEELGQLKKRKDYFILLKYGQIFMTYISSDLNRKCDGILDSTKRKRLRKEIRKGKISPELIHHYGKHIDRILAKMLDVINPLEKQKQTIREIADCAKKMEEK